MNDATAATPEPASQPDATPPATCRNCAATLHGPHCHACGQPVKGLMRPLGSLFGDVMDSVFDLDIRTFRTIGPLFAKPGFLSAEYFAGRQIRYVTPFRLFFFLAIITFFFAQLTPDVDSDIVKVNTETSDKSDNDAIGSATTVADVERERDARLANLAAAKARMANTPAKAGIGGIEAGEAQVRAAATERIRQLREAEAKGEAPPPPMQDGFNINFNGKRWDRQKNPVDTWAPAFVDRWLNAQVARGNDNIERLKKDRTAFKNAVLSAVPSTLFVLVPIFALMLKIAYVFKRRLYMEHVVVALHSHAFLCLDLLLVLLVRALEQWVAPNPGALASAFGWIEGLLILWMPVYLLLMQKRVYAQGWPMTLLKYFLLGTCYTVLLSFAIVASMAIGLVAM